MKELIYILLLALAVSCSQPLCQQASQSEAPVTEAASDESIIATHQWRELEEKDYLFKVPTPEQIESWKALCQERNPLDSQTVKKVPGYYHSERHYVTLWDFAGLWWDENNPLTDDYDLALWRLAQYDTEGAPGASECDKFARLRSLIAELCDFDPQFGFEYGAHAAFMAGFQEFYTGFLTTQAITHSPGRVSKALENENRAWRSYHKALEAGFHIYHDDPSGFGGNVEPRATMRILSDDARIRATSLQDYYFILTDGTAQIQLYNIIPLDRVKREYEHFIKSMQDDEYRYPLTKRRQVLREEMSAWLRWMNSRDVVSSLLTGARKAAYDNATNTARRMKLIMLKNCYEGYEVTSLDAMPLLIPYDALDDQLDGSNFNEKWQSSKEVQGIDSGQSTIEYYDSEDYQAFSRITAVDRI